MKRIPCATYRLQFNRDFTFQRAGEILDYLGDLGVSDVYASPLFEAGPESTHGYDTCCFGKLNPNLGSAEDFERFCKALNDRGFGLLFDLVPNHMSATTSNAWWLGVLRNGPDSAYAKFFDIDWRPNNPTLQGKVLLPVLEDHYGTVLESGKLRLTFQDGEFFISYYDRNFPVNRATMKADGMNNSAALLKDFNGMPGNARSFDKLDALIQRQHYRLAYWRIAPEEINYRRFFDVVEMVAMKMELPEVFRATHELVFDWLKAGKVTGLRIDHPDGLWDPKEYLQRLQASVADSQEKPIYIVVEKILSGDEQLPADWPVAGTTGYDFLNRVNGLFVDRFNALAFDEIYREFTDNNSSFAEIVYNSRRRVLDRAFASELNALTHRLRDIAARSRSWRDFTFSELRRALEEIAASFPVYRTYISETSTQVSAEDRKVIQKAVSGARERINAPEQTAVFEFIERVLLLEIVGELDDAGAKSAREFAMKFQQLTGPAMAKGLEDTAFYQFNRLVSLNEVGGEPEKFGVTPPEFHEANSAAAEHWPQTMLASATHDTKRGEDVRARLNVLSEMPFEWRAAASRWSRLNRRHKTTVKDALAPDSNDEYLLYQTLVGAWPVGGAEQNLAGFRTRVAAFMLKAVKEAKVHTSWTEPNAAYEKAVRDFVERVLDAGNEIFLDDSRSFARRIAFFGRFNSLAQTLLKIASPGVPDFYQGTELWDLNLVDPDNRRPVDYALRQKLLSEVKKKFETAQIGSAEFFSNLLKEEDAGSMKLFLIWRALNFRRTQRELFDSGDYLPLTASGGQQEHLCAFARALPGKKIIVVVPRLVFGLASGTEVPPTGDRIWKDTFLTLPKSRSRDSFRNVLTGETVDTAEYHGKTGLEAGKVLKNFPVALLEKIN
ncbi:MAG TPA: malto-oligosyltrehalose synthase [Verrucomicrobiae bacterium]|jgi:(1->4)-alpha-D-glucan 1-alpha-D-glucosylmutase